MLPFKFVQASSAEAAVQSARPADKDRSTNTEYLAGGTTLVDLMKLNVMRPDRLVGLRGLRGPFDTIDITPRGVRFGSMVSMATAADHPDIKRDYPVIAQALTLAASQQLRNMATLGGNVLQKTRCAYFRDTSWSECNKRQPGTGCAASNGMNRQHAVLGGSKNCVATYPGDLAQALIALDAVVETLDSNGTRKIPFSELHLPPGKNPHMETTLRPGELITSIVVPAGAWTKRSTYVKIRDRESYQFALASAAVALHIENDLVVEARIGLGGVATLPWRAKEAEQLLRGRPLDETAAREASDAAYAEAEPLKHNAFKIVLGKKTLERALIAAATMEV